MSTDLRTVRSYCKQRWWLRLPITVLAVITFPVWGSLVVVLAPFAIAYDTLWRERERD